MNRLTEIAKELKDVNTALKTTEIVLLHQREDLAARKVYITPPEGWPGKNAEQRETEATRACLSDETCQTLAKLIRDNESQIANLQAQQSALVDERRALEYTIRARMVEYLTGQSIYPDEPEENGIDAFLDATTENLTHAEIDYVAHDQLATEPDLLAEYDMPPIVSDDIPF